MQNMRADQEARAESLSQAFPRTSRMPALSSDLYKKGQPELAPETGPFTTRTAFTQTPSAPVVDAHGLVPPIVIRPFTHATRATVFWPHLRHPAVHL